MKRYQIMRENLNKYYPLQEKDMIINGLVYELDAYKSMERNQCPLLKYINVNNLSYWRYVMH